jgi:hypothetical protein
MDSQQIMWIAIPNGIKFGKAQLSICVMPRLRTDGEQTLASFDFANWPERLAPGNFECTIVANEKPIASRVVSTPDPTVWAALFRGDTFVRSFEPEATLRVFSSYPAARLAERVKASYQDLMARSLIERPRTEHFNLAFSDLSALHEPMQTTAIGVISETLTMQQKRELCIENLFQIKRSQSTSSIANQLVDLVLNEARDSLKRTEATKYRTLVPNDGDPRSDYAQFLVFHQQACGNQSSVRLSADTRIDFHQWLTTLSAYPNLLRRLGLIIDVELEAGKIPEAIVQEPGVMHVIPSFIRPLSNKTQQVTPGTAYIHVKNQGFRAANFELDTTSAEVRDGFVNLGAAISSASKRPRYGIVQFDVDSATHKAINLVRMNTRDADDGAVSPIRTSGVSIVQDEYARALDDVHTRTEKKLNEAIAGQPVRLFSEDLMRGYRIDVRDTVSNEWRSLHERKVEHAIDNVVVASYVDEGWMEPNIVQGSGKDEVWPLATSLDPEKPLHVTESLFLWNGWSLSVPRPALRASHAQTSTTDAAPVRPLNLDTKVGSISGSLPRLRFGTQYHFRARCVDLAGNGLTLLQAKDGPDAPEVPGAEKFRFRRFEIVSPPQIFFRTKALSGDAIDRIVLRSDHNLSASAWSDENPDYLLSTERHIAPPEVSQMVAEMSGLFDDGIGVGRDSSAVFQTASRAAKHDNQEGIHLEPAMRVDYLPDPLAAGAVFCDLPGVPIGKMGRVLNDRLEYVDLPPLAEQRKSIKSIVLIDFGQASEWPNARPFRLQLIEGSDSPKWNANERVLLVALPKAETHKVRLACYLPNTIDTDTLGICAWKSDWLSTQSFVPFEREQHEQVFRQSTLPGLNWMVTPYRELILVHAVQTPMAAPDILSFTPPGRVMQRTSAYINAKVRAHIDSSESLELFSDWIEKIDNLEHNKPDAISRSLLVFPEILPLPIDTDRISSMAGALVFDESVSSIAYLAPDVQSIGDGAESRHSALRGAIFQAKSPPPNSVRLLDIDLLDRVWHTVRQSLDNKVQPLDVRLADIAKVAVQVQFTAQAEVDFITAGINDVPSQPPAPLGSVRQLENVINIANDLSNFALNSIAKLNQKRAQEFGDTRYRRVAYRAVATSRFANYFARETTRNSDLVCTRSSTPSEFFDVLSSASPPVPSVQYVIPLFLWSRERNDVELTSSRRVGVRVYLERPWFVSGEGEMLGVILETETNHPLFPSHLVTHWGRDMLWNSERTPFAVPESFRKAKTVAFEEVNGRRRAVIAYEINDNSYDESGRLFCDIEMDTGDTYFPFVRLALARYQPNSLDGLKLSQIVMADFVQLAPNRQVSLISLGNDTFSATVTGRTHQSFTNPLRPKDGRSGTTVRLSVQRRIPGGLDDAAWLPASDVSPVTEEALNSIASGELLWKGIVHLPHDREPGQYRLLIEELETHVGLDPDSSFELNAVERTIFAEAMVL